MDLIRLETDHAQLRARTQHRRQDGKQVIRTKYYAQLVQARQIIRQAAQLITGQIQNFQAIGQLKDFRWKRSQATRQRQATYPRQPARAQFFQSMRSRHDSLSKTFDVKPGSDPTPTSMIAPAPSGGLTPAVQVWGFKHVLQKNHQTKKNPPIS